MITIQGLEKRYKDGDQEIVALHLPYAEFDRGTQWAVVGPSGSGKSTLLHCLAGIIRADGGQIKTGEGILTDFDEDALQSWRSIEIGYIFQDFNLIDALTVKENIFAGMGELPKLMKEFQEISEKLLDGGFQYVFVRIVRYF